MKTLYRCIAMGEVLFVTTRLVTSGKKTIDILVSAHLALPKQCTNHIANLIKHHIRTFHISLRANKKLGRLVILPNACKGKHIFFGWFHLYIYPIGTYFGSCMGRSKRWIKHWKCDIPKVRYRYEPSYPMVSSPPVSINLIFRF